MRRVSIATAILCLLAGPVGAKDEKGSYTMSGTAINKCSEYLSAYGQSQIKLKGETVSAAPRFWLYIGFFDGYMTAVNAQRSGKKDWYEGLDSYVIAAWMSSWCRDNLSKDIANGMHDLTLQQIRKK